MPAMGFRTMVRELDTEALAQLLDSIEESLCEAVSESEHLTLREERSLVEDELARRRMAARRV